MMTVESRVKKVVADVTGVDSAHVDLFSTPVSDDDIPLLVSRLSEEFGQGVFRGLLPNSIKTVSNIVDAIRPVMQAGPRYCRCSNSKCNYRGEGTDGQDCPTCTGGKLVCKIL
jgi:hypothetical protein